MVKILDNIRRDELNTDMTIQKTLMTASLFTGFWDRWFAHGVPKDELEVVRSRLTTLTQWQRLLEPLAAEWAGKARGFAARGLAAEAEYAYRLAGLYYNLIQWVYPEACVEKLQWFDACAEAIRLADRFCTDQIVRCVLRVGNRICFGRCRIPLQPHGCLVFITPYDSSKEELFTYEQDFARCGFVTISFDGPGQGETYTRNGFKASRAAWQRYVEQAVDYAVQYHPELPVYLFGTSSGGAWALSGGSHPNVQRIAAVSPACTNEIRLPDYFLERPALTLEPGETNILPTPSRIDTTPVFLFHGKKDVMVTDRDIDKLYQRLPEGRRLLTYDGEGHCCNYKLGEIRMLAADWYKESEKERA